jgi:hypothetical protein
VQRDDAELVLPLRPDAPAPPPPSQQAAIRVFEQNTASVVNITHIRTMQNFHTLDIHRIPYGQGSGFIWNRRAAGLLLAGMLGCWDAGMLGCWDAGPGWAAAGPGRAGHLRAAASPARLQRALGC